jgi:hypothetical protein
MFYIIRRLFGEEGLPRRSPPNFDLGSGGGFVDKEDLHIFYQAKSPHHGSIQGYAEIKKERERERESQASKLYPANKKGLT